MNLDEISKKYGTDKSSSFHNYCHKYEKYLTLDKLKSSNILEIGVHTGASLRAWREYFPLANIIGIDINSNCKSIENYEDRIKIEIGSQEDSNFLTVVGEKYCSFDLILDDGSHQSEHMIKSFESLFPYLENGGQYVIEDTCCSYWENFGGGYKKASSIIEYCKNLIDDVNFHGAVQKNIAWNARREDFLVPQLKDDGVKFRLDIESIIFLNSIIIINKR